MNPPLIIVAGFPRCGSSLTMQMLNACGIKCAGEFPAFEPDECKAGHRGLTGDWLSQFEAVKMLDPHRLSFPRVDARVIWLDRDPVHQSVSMIKFIYQVIGIDAMELVKAGAAGKIVRGMREAEPPALAAFGCMPACRLRFEDAICNTRAYCYQIAEFLPPELAHRLDILKMMACVRPRINGAATQPTMGIELHLCALAEAKEPTR